MRLNLSPVTKNFLIINIVIFLIQIVLNLPLPELLGYRYIFAESFQPYQLFTYMFVHANGWHLFGNMFALFIFGPMLEQYMGSKRFLILYMVTGLGAGLLYATVNFIEVSQMESALIAFQNTPTPENLHHFINQHTGGYEIYKPVYQEEIYNFVNKDFPEDPTNPAYIERARSIIGTHYQFNANMPMVGASGAVFGILMAFGLLFPNLQLMLLIPPMPVRAKYLVAFYAIYSIYALLENAPGDNIAHLAHIGGMVFAFILIKAWGLKSTNFM